MKTFTLNKPYEELSFNEIILIFIAIADSTEIVKIIRNGEVGYNIKVFRAFKDFENNDELNLNFLSFLWKISSGNKNKDKLKNQNSIVRNQLDSYLESAINLKLIDLK